MIYHTYDHLEFQQIELKKYLEAVLWKMMHCVLTDDKVTHSINTAILSIRGSLPLHNY